MRLAELADYETTDSLAPVIERARAIRDGELPAPVEPDGPLRR